MEKAMKVNANHFADMKELLVTGDISLAERRATFKRVMNRETTLDDEKLIAAIAATDDDDDELFAKNVCEIEASGFELVASAA